MHKLLAIAAWTALALIVFLTISPLNMRSVVTADPNIERFVAFALVGLLFGLAYPGRLLVDASLVMIAAGVLEAFQLMARGRHGHIADAFVKAAGGAFGVALALMILFMLERRKAR
jgi:VanZ family protein